jgi:serine protease Do
VDLKGQIVGINTAIASQTGGYQGIGFAIPGNLAREVTAQLSEQGQVRRAYLGIGIQDLTGKLAEQISAGTDIRGVVVTEVRKGKPADQAGIKPGDIITHFADGPVTTRAELQRSVERVPIGSNQTVRLVRLGRAMTVRVTTSEFDQTSGEYRQLLRPNNGDATLGMTVYDIAEVARQLGENDYEDGVIVTNVDVNGLADEEGIHPGVIVLQVRDTPVKTVAEFQQALRQESLARGILLLVHDPRHGNRFVVLKSRS